MGLLGRTSCPVFALLIPECFMVPEGERTSPPAAVLSTTLPPSGACIGLPLLWQRFFRQ